MKNITYLLLIILLNCNNLFSQEINITGNLVSIPDNDTTPVISDFTDFGTLNSRTFTIQNTSAIILTLGTISISGTNANEFSVTSFPSTSIAGGSSTTFTVTFNPISTGLKNATLSIVNNDSNENPYDFSIKGTGISNEINILGNAVAIIDGDTTPSVTDWTDFGSADIISGAVLKIYTIQNTGTMTLTLGAINFTGVNASDFKVVNSPTLNLIGNGLTTLIVKFIPSALGLRAARISIINDDSNENPYDFSIQGNGTAQTMAVYGGLTGTNVVPDGDISTIVSNYTNFQSTNVSSPIYRTFVIKNLGGTSINLTGTPIVTISGSSEFVISTQAISPVPVTGSRSFIVTFTPTSIGVKTATISINNNDTGVNKNPYTFVISGEGIQKFIDTDSDGVFDHLDSDDDNDGIPDTREQSFVSGNTVPMTTDLILLNESFGNSTIRARINVNIPTATTDYCYEDGTPAQAIDECDTDYSLNDGNYSVSNTAQCASWASQYWYTGLDHTTGDVDGRMGLFNATISTTAEFYRTVVQGVILGAPVTYSFWALNLDRTDAPNIGTRPRPQLEVDFFDLNNNIIPGSKIITGDVPPSSTTSNLSSDWHFYTITFTPTTTNGFSIVFRNKQIGGGGNDLALDDIIVKQILTDADGDGGADIYDLDSDNDGIGGIIEDGWKSLSNGKDTLNLIPIISGGTWLDVNNNGFHDTCEAYYATYTQRDFDGDSVPNYVDLDSDNDANFDVDEAGIYNGDGDVNCDGEGEGNDIDKDGILSKFDTFSGFANGIKSLPLNSLLIGNEDYLKTSSKIAGITDISLTLFSSLDSNLDGIIDGNADLDKDGILDTFDTNNNYFGSPRDLNKKLYLDFDGRNDYGEATSILGGLPAASIMAWVDLNTDFVTDGVIFGQDKFQIRINTSRNIEAIINGSTLTYTGVNLNKRQWYHVSATFGAGSLKLYLNGLLVATQNVSGAISADASLLTIGKNPIVNNNYFKGKIDELRVFNVALTEKQLQRMVYQEINDFGGQVRGEIVPKNIETLPYINLLRYYRMDVYKNDIIDDFTTTTFDINNGMKIFNNKVIWYQEAPMPFITERNGDFATATDNILKDIRGLDVIEFDWSIIKVKHNIIEFSNNTDLGMFVDSGKTISVNNDNKIQNNWYLKLDGKIDLNGKSQLVQNIESDLDPTSAGLIERDQQGHSNLFNYNYWSSPVGTINNTTNNNAYTVAGVMKDGTTATPQNITWTTGYNGSPTSPITLSSYWIYKFQNLSPVYANWQSVGSSGSLNAGQGYTLKGSGGEGLTQNLSFVGKPNNGAISSAIAANNLNLSGNPYASSIDAKQFILDNSTSSTGAIYFWEHSATNNTHVTVGYQGGYATRNATGGVAPVAPTVISGVGTSAKVPGRYIPVGQGFFVKGSATGGNITFNNNQRIFIKEDDIDSNTLFKQNTFKNYTTPLVEVYNNSSDEKPEDEFKKIRLGFKSTDNFYKQALLGFMENNATDNLDYGYDAINIDSQVNDMYFINSGANLNIQGVGYFNANNIYPLGVKNNVAGDVVFRIEETQNFDFVFEAYIFDNVTNIYHNIMNNDFTIALPQGTINNRFSLRFKNQSALATDNFNLSNGIQIAYTNANSVLTIKNNVYDTTVETVTLYNMIGQTVSTWKVNDQNQQNIVFPIKNLSSGTYIAKVKTDKGDTSRKIVFN